MWRIWDRAGVREWGAALPRRLSSHAPVHESGQATGGRDLDARSDGTRRGGGSTRCWRGSPHTGRRPAGVDRELVTERPTRIRTVRDRSPRHRLRSAKALERCRRTGRTRRSSRRADGPGGGLTDRRAGGGIAAACGCGGPRRPSPRCGIPGGVLRAAAPVADVRSVRARSTISPGIQRSVSERRHDGRYHRPVARNPGLRSSPGLDRSAERRPFTLRQNADTLGVRHI